MDPVVLYEELSMNAHPALQTALLDGWVLRFAGGYTNRANSVSPLYPAALPARDKVPLCEAAYAAQGLPAVFKLTERSAQLDDLLKARGYALVTPTAVMAARICGLRLPPPYAVRVETGMPPAWVEAFLRLCFVEGGKARAARALKAAILPRTLCASVEVAGEPAACGLCVLERGHAGLYDIAVGGAHRGKGIGTGVCAALLRAAAVAGASGAYLQVIADNAAAVSIYQKLGFTERYRYWYRVQPREGTPCVST